MAGLDFARAYLDDLLIISRGSFDENLEQLEQALTRLAEAGLKINASKSSLCRGELEYLGYWITRKGIMHYAGHRVKSSGVKILVVD